MNRNQNPATNWGLVLAVFGAGVVAAFQVGKAPPSLPLMRPDLSLSLVAAGWVISALNLVGALGGLLSGSASDLLGHRRAILIGLLIIALGNLGGALADGPGLLLASRFLEGLGYILVVVPAPVLIVRLSNPRNIRQALGLWTAFMPTGLAIMMLLSPLILAFSSWRGLWLVNGGLVLAYTLFLARVTGEMPTSSSPREKRSGSLLADIRVTLTAAAPLTLSSAFMVYALQYLAVMGFMPTLFVEDLGWSTSLAAVATAGVAFMNAPGSLLGGWLLQRGVRRVRLICLAALVMGLCGLGIYSPVLSGTTKFLLGLLYNLFAGFVPSSLISGSQVHAPKPSLVATTNGLVMQGANVGGLVGPPLLALTVALAGGWTGPRYMVAASIAILITLALILGRLEAKKELD